MTTMNTNTMNTTFTFRSKFEKIVSDENRPVIEATFEKFCNFDPTTTYARNLLWDLTYNPEVASATLQDLGLNHEIIAPENVCKLRDELRYQYEKLHNGYLAVNVSEDRIPAFEALSKKAGPIVASLVNELCLQRLYGSDVPRTLHLLKSEKENFFFGGICDVGFMPIEAEYLKPFHMQIHDLLKAMYDAHQEAARNTPLSGLDSIIKDAGIELPFYVSEIPATAPLETPAEASNEAQDKQPAETPNEAQGKQPVETNLGFKALTPDAILEHKDVFTAFVESSDMNILLKIGNLGFDLNNVIAKKEAIRKVLEATLLMFEATKALNG